MSVTLAAGGIALKARAVSGIVTVGGRSVELIEFGAVIRRIGRFGADYFIGRIIGIIGIVRVIGIVSLASSPSACGAAAVDQNHVALNGDSGWADIYEAAGCFDGQLHTGFQDQLRACLDVNLL